MTIRNLDALFHPRSVALIGASNQAGSVGSVIARNLLEGGFAGPIMPVNPHETAIRSTLGYRTIGALPRAPDLAVIATPAPTVPQIVADLGAAGCRAAVVVSAGFGEGDLRQQLLDAAKPHLLRIVGPNCLGFISPAQGLNASFAHLSPAPGGLALVSQSGAIAAAAIDWAASAGVGFSHIVTIGDAADVDFGDLIDYLALDTATRAIVLYVESITDARKFMSAGRAAARTKPVVVIKAGRSAAGAKAAFSHTGALAGADEVYDAAFRRAGMLRVADLRELFDAAETLSAGLSVAGDRLAILTNGGGAGVLAADALSARGGRLAELSPVTTAALTQVMPGGWRAGNPVDILGDARPERYAAAMQALLQAPEADALLVINCPVAVADSTNAAQAVIEAAQAIQPRPPVLTCWLGEKAVAEGRRRLSAAGLSSHETPGEAVRAFMHLADHARQQTLLLEAPGRGPEPVDLTEAKAVVDAALQAGRTSLSAQEAARVLKAYGIAVVADRIVKDSEGAAQAASQLGVPVALKIRSPDITHKSDVGGVALHLADAAAVRAAAEAMLAKVRAGAPQARLEGFTVQPMIHRPQARELIAGLSRDPTFGPVVLFGHGGVAVEVLADRVIGLPPLNAPLAKDMIARTRVSNLLQAHRDRTPADLDAVADVLARLSRLATDLPEIAELDINPLLADADGVLALDARVRLEPAGVRAALRPYPSELTTTVEVDGVVLTLRAIRPDDADRLIALVERCDPEDLRFRFGAAVRHLPLAWARRLAQIDYERQLAIVAEAPDGDLLGVVRLASDPEGETAEFALLVRSDWRNRGLGRRLLQALLAIARARGVRRVWGDVSLDNGRMLDLAEHLGFVREAAPDPTEVRLLLETS